MLPAAGNKMTATIARCPVCRNKVIPDCDYRINKHRDGIGRICRDGIGLPFRTTTSEEYA